MQRLEALERGGGGTMNKYDVALSSNGASNIQPKLIIDPKTNSVKIEETLKVHMEILTDMNGKLNNHMG